VTSRIIRWPTAAFCAFLTFLSATVAFSKPQRITNAVIEIQPATSGLTIEVTDTSYGAIPKAQILLVDEHSNNKFSGETDEGGRVRFPNLASGNYKIAVRALGFKNFHRSHLTVPSKVSLKLVIDMKAAI
jgi:hypothetical protein